MSLECLKNMYIKSDIENESLEKKLRSKLYDVSGKWWKIERNNDHLKLTESSGYNVEITPDILLKIEESLGCDLQIKFCKCGDLILEEIRD